MPARARRDYQQRYQQKHGAEHHKSHERTDNVKYALYGVIGLFPPRDLQRLFLRGDRGSVRFGGETALFPDSDRVHGLSTLPHCHRAFCTAERFIIRLQCNAPHHTHRYHFPHNNTVQRQRILLHISVIFTRSSLKYADTTASFGATR